MSMAISAKTAKQRANIAIRMIKYNSTFSRKFDDCFEMGDGDQVMNCIIEKARMDKELAMALKEKMPSLGYGDRNKKMHEAINECLNGPLDEPTLFHFDN